MTDANATFARWFAELRRRKVVRVAVVYVVIGWLLIQIADATFEPIGLPSWANRLVIVLAVLGFPLVCALAWAFDVTPRGIERTGVPAEPSLERITTDGRTQGGSSRPDVARPAAAAAPAPAPAGPSVAILPFADMSAARDQEYFCDGIAEEIINALCCVRGLQVASRTSSFQFKGRSIDVREIGRSLGVTAVLEGSVRRSAERVRITAQLVSSSDGFHLWSESFDRGLEDVFATQSEIARNIVNALRSSLTAEEAEMIERGGTRDPQAYEYYLRARQLHNDQSDTAVRQAIGLYRRAVQADPQFAKAHAGLAAALGTAISWRMGGVGPDAMAEAMRAAERAHELVPDLPEAWLAQGNLLSAARQYADADRAFEKALQGNPDSFEGLLLYARHAFTSGQTARSAELFRRARLLEPDDYTVVSLLSNCLRKLGDEAGALEADRATARLIERRLELYPEDTRALHLAAGAYARLGQREQALAVSERALALRPREFATLYNVACAYALLGEKERALAILEGFGEVGQGSFDWIREDPDFVSLHGDPRFERAVARLVAATHAPGTG